MLLRCRDRNTLVACLLIATLFAACTGGEVEPEAIPEEIIRHNIIGTAHLSQQDWDKARAAFEQGLVLRPDDPVLLVNVAVALLQQGENDRAEESLRQALAAAPEDPYAHYNLGLIEKNRGNSEAAVAHFNHVTAHDPDDVAARYNLGSALGRLGRNDEAEREFRTGLANSPTHVSTLYALGRLLLQTDHAEEGTELINSSQQIRARSGADSAMGTQYGEQGPYAMGVDYPGGGITAPSAIPVQLVALSTQEQGRYPAIVAAVEQQAVPGTVGDVTGDGTAELVQLMRSGGGWELWLDGGTDRRALALDHEPEVTAGDLVLVDRDHDGDLDLYGCLVSLESTTCFLGDNDGSGNFQIAGDTGVEFTADPAGPIDLTFSDYDNDRDIDLLAADGSGLRVFANVRDGTFRDVSAEIVPGESLGGVFAVQVADLNKDSWMDLVVAGADGPRLLVNRRGKFAIDPAAGIDWETSYPGAEPTPGVVAWDYDNDGLLDLAVSDGGPLRVFRNLGRGEWRDTTSDLVPEPARERRMTPRSALDFDEDGDIDLVGDSGGSPQLLDNHGGNANHWIEIRPRGERDNRFGVGTKVEVLAGALRQKFEVTGPVPVHMGLGTREAADAVRLLWPGGVLQDELALSGGGPAEIVQLDRKGTSCPLLYAWRDGQWHFVTDFLGGCAIGYCQAPGRFSTPDTDEYVLIEGGLTAGAGTLRLRINNQLEEVIWLDRTELVVIDHPTGTVVYPNERLMPGPPFVEFGLFASADVRPIRSARIGETGADVTAALSERDRRYVDGFELKPFKGYAELHSVELQLGDLPQGARTVLLLDGWIDYADSTANVGASQAGFALIPPRLYVGDGGGGWRDISGRMGFPAGLPKTMAVDLSDALQTGDPRVRIETNMRIYWDRAQVMVGGAQTPLRVTRLSADTAELRDGGFPAEDSEDGRRPFGYDPSRAEQQIPWKVHAGSYTAFGEVRALLSAIDDRLVTTRSGDELELRFAEPAAPPAGWTRSYLLFADGFGKDMDTNSAANSEVGPVPFHGMPTYPYGPDVAPPHLPDEDQAARRAVHSGNGHAAALPLILRDGVDRAGE